MYLVAPNGELYKSYTLNSTSSSTSSYEPLGSMAVDYEHGKVWYIYRNHITSRSILGYVDTRGNTQEYTLSSSIGSSVSSVAVGSDGNIWYSGSTYYGYIDPSGTLGSLVSTSTMGLSVGAARLATGLDGRLWGTHVADIALSGTTLSSMTSPYIYNSFSGPGMYYTGSMPIGLTAGNDGNMWFTLYANYTIGKIGTGVSGSSIDEDGDGLTLDKETKQGTSDKLKDSDGDGLSDLVESEWYPDRDDVFCGTSACAYPHPMQKDIYVEVDWMDTGSYSMKPDTTQLNMVIASFANKGINLVFDTGLYSGGNEVPYSSVIDFAPNTGLLDFYDIKNGTSSTAANFSTDREGIWHYMISGDKWRHPSGDTTRSGVSYPADDDLFLAYKYIDDTPGFGYSDLDTAIAGTITHELGHNLCLSRNSYTGADTACVYDCIDNQGTDSGLLCDGAVGMNLYYVSSMNYMYQMFMVDYSSNPASSSRDHDDWVAISNNMHKFATSTMGDSVAHGLSSFSKNGKLYAGVNLETAQKVRANKKLHQKQLDVYKEKKHGAQKNQ